MLLFIAQVMSYFLHVSHELLFIAQVTSYFLTMNYDKDKDDKDAMIVMLSQKITL